MVNINQRFDLKRFKSSHKASMVACLEAITGRNYSFIAYCFGFLYEKNQKHHGDIYATKYLKSLYNYGVRMALEYPIKDIEPIPYRRISRHGIPRDLRFFRKGLTDKSRLVRRCVLSILNLHEGIEGPLTYDLDTVVTKSVISQAFLDGLIKDFNHPMIKSRLTLGKLSEDDIQGFGSMFVSAKSGPNGKALEKAHLDALALMRDPQLRDSVIDLLTIDYRYLNCGLSPPNENEAPMEPPGFIELAGNVENFSRSQIFLITRRLKLTYTPQSFTSMLGFEQDWCRMDAFLHFKNRYTLDTRKEIVLHILKSNAEYAERSEPNKEFSSGASHSCIRFLPAKSCKTRVIALFDYWSQLGLRPIHKLFFDNLRKMPMGTDATFDHSKAADRLAKWVSSGRRVWSFDLTAATDLFPSIVSKGLISVLYGEELANAWHKVMTERDFNVANRPSYTVRYGTGQPMGALSSWPVFAVTHHAVVLVSALRAGYSPKTFIDYVIIGDDIVIANERVAMVYQEIMVEELKCKISLGKSVISSETVCRGEVAKRIFIMKDEITPLNPGLCNELWKSTLNTGSFSRKTMVSLFKTLPTFLRLLHSKGWFSQSPRLATSTRGGLLSTILALAFKRPISLTKLKNRSSAVSAFYRRAMTYLVVPGVLPVGILKHVDLESTLRERFGSERDRFFIELLLFEHDLSRTLKRMDKDMTSSAQRLAKFASIYSSSDVKTLVSSRVGSDLTEHPLLDVYFKDLETYAKKLVEYDCVDVVDRWLGGKREGVVLPPFSAQYIADFYELTRVSESLVILDVLHWSKMLRSKDHRKYFDVSYIKNLANRLKPDRKEISFPPGEKYFIGGVKPSMEYCVLLLQATILAGSAN